jgi:hypothetical protein
MFGQRPLHCSWAGVAIARESKYIHLAYFVFDLLALCLTILPRHVQSLATVPFSALDVRKLFLFDSAAKS